jgi:hypothetical protein
VADEQSAFPEVEAPNRKVVAYALIEGRRRKAIKAALIVVSAIVCIVVAILCRFEPAARDSCTLREGWTGGSQARAEYAEGPRVITDSAEIASFIVARRLRMLTTIRATSRRSIPIETYPLRG